MLCERCHVNPATVHLKKSINGVLDEKHLCQTCAEETGELQILNLGNPLGSFFETLLGSMELKPAMMQTKCEVCGLTFDDFRQKGEFGCSDCYVTFREELKPILRRIQGDVIHNGKVPKRAGGTLSIKREIEKLRDNLKELVAKEEYEKAAKVRDEIKKLEAQSGGEEQ